METNDQVMGRWLAKSLSDLQREANRLHFGDASMLIGAAELAVAEELSRLNGTAVPSD